MVREQITTSEKTSRLPMVLGLAGLILILGMAVMLAFIDFKYTPLNGDVSVDNHILHLKNNSDYEWKDVRLLLNTDYKLNTPRLGPHSEFGAPLIEFKKDDGTLFDVDFTLVDLYITAITPEKQTISNIFKFNK